MLKAPLQLFRCKTPQQHPDLDTFQRLESRYHKSRMENCQPAFSGCPFVCRRLTPPGAFAYLARDRSGSLTDCGPPSPIAGSLVPYSPLRGCAGTSKVCGAASAGAVLLCVFFHAANGSALLCRLPGGSGVKEYARRPSRRLFGPLLVFAQAGPAPPSLTHPGPPLGGPLSAYPQPVPGVPPPPGGIAGAPGGLVFRCL